MTVAEKRLKRIAFSRVVVISLLFCAQFALLLLFILKLSRYFAAMYGVFVLISAAVALAVINRDINPAYKLAWVMPLMLFPLFGGLFYIIFCSSHLGRRVYRRVTEEEKLSGLSSSQSRFASEAVGRLPAQLKNQSAYIYGRGYPAYTGTGAEYFSPGERAFEEMKAAIKGASRFIFMEYFIIDEGAMWRELLNLLCQKVKEGVDVRIIYDGFGCLTTLPRRYDKRLAAMGIKCIEFNPLIPVFSMFMNNRDHRKILVADGRVGFMGGMNIADEYINRIEKHGHWKDSAIKLTGGAVRSLTAMFVTMWNAFSPDRLDMGALLPDDGRAGELNGVVQPYSDSPLDNEQVGEAVYLNMISKAQRYIYITTPYLIIGNEMITALLLAAKSGVDVRIITPHIGDAWYVHLTTRAHYPQLVRGGVKIYEYTPGFIHAKTFVCDDRTATVGTVNLDYRSLYLHFECGVWMADTDAVLAMREDFLATQSLCEQMTDDSPQLRFSGLKGLISAILRLFAPLM